MSQAPAEADELDDQDHASTIPEPPRRVPFGVAVTTVLLGLLSLLLIFGAVLSLSAGSSFSDSVGEASAEGLASAGIAVAAVLVAAVAWHFARNGDTIGSMIVGGLVLLLGLIFLISGLGADEGDTDGMRWGVLSLVLGLGVLLTPLLGHAPAYLAARRVWAKAERDWLHELTTPAVAPVAFQQQWPGQYPPPQQWGAPPQPGYPALQPGHAPHQQPGYPAQQPQWGAPPQEAPQAQWGAPPPQEAPQAQWGAPPQEAPQAQWGAPPAGAQQQPGYSAGYQYPPQQPAQAWGDPQAQQYQAWPDPAVSGQQAPVQPTSSVPSSAVPASTPPAPESAPPASAPPAYSPAAPYAAAQQAPTEQIQPEGQVAPPPVPQEKPQS